MSNLHIIIYSPFPNYTGGRENWLINILPRISGSFNKIFLYVYKSDRAPIYDLSNLKNVVIKEVYCLRQKDLLFSVLNLFSVKLLFLLDILFFFRKEVRKSLKQVVMPKDIILAMNSITELQPPVDLITENYNVKVVCSVRGLVPLELGNSVPYFRRKFELMEKKLLPFCSTVLANGYDTQAYLKNQGIDSFIVPNGVDVSHFKNPDLLDSELDIIKELKSSNFKIILMVATLRKIKGIDDLIFAGKILNDLGLSRYKLVFVGKGNPDPFRNTARKLKIEDNVLFVGEQKNIAGFLHLSDLVVCTSGGSGMSMAALEAMAACRPIVAWDTPVYRQLLTHMKDSYLATYPNHQELAKGIMLLLNNFELTEKFAFQLNKKITDFDWDVISKKLLNCLEN
jgi:glycosyltransferase involved in cell wall biosynthesis